jgi:3-hydroxyisobutyrate dehydrogenase
MFETLAAVLADAAAHLTRAARDRKSPMHVPVVGTGDGDLRMMVLRACDPEIGLLRFHTDARSAKTATIAANGLASVLAFDPEAKIQLRLRGAARIETSGPVADAAWAAASEYARRCYLAVGAPGSPAERPGSGLPAEVEGIRPSEDQLLPARENFAVLLIEPLSLDWLYLAHDGHRRAQFARAAPGQDWQGTWVIP